MTYYYTQQYYPDSLEHYGVPGMKWGVRRNIRVLANRRRNVAVKDIKNDYETGRITKGQKQDRIKAANAKKKTEIQRMRKRVDRAAVNGNLDKVKQDIAKQTIKEVPAHTLKKGLTTVNKLIGGYNTAGIVGTGLIGAAVAPPLAGAFITSAAVGAAAEIGAQHVRQMLIDRVIT